MDGMEDLQDWIGRSETAECEVTAEPADILAATFDRDDAPLQPGDPIPPGWHWYYFHEVVRLADTGADGHPKRGGFMPPVALPRRMWAGSELFFHRPITVGGACLSCSAERGENRYASSGRSDMNSLSMAWAFGPKYNVRFRPLY